MKLKNWIFLSGVLIALASCGENSTTETKNTDSTASASDNANTNNTSATGKTVEVPAATRTSFESKYPNASNVTWTYYEEPYTTIDWEWTGWPTVDANDYMVRYNWDGMDYYSWYDQDGNWIGTTNVITNFSSLPSAVNNTINKQYAGYTVVSADKENDKNREAYEVQLEKGDNKVTALIAADGTVLKKKGTVDGEKVKEKADVK